MQGLSNLAGDFDPNQLSVPGQAPLTHKIVGRKRETAQLAPLNHAAYTGGGKGSS